jgi:hypothetical protein
MLHAKQQKCSIHEFSIHDLGINFLMNKKFYMINIFS